jgi:hypothetical protein
VAQHRRIVPPYANPGPHLRPHPIHDLQDNGEITSLATVANVSDLLPHIVPNDRNAAAAFPSPAPSAFLSLPTDSDQSDAGRLNKGENVHQHVGLPPCLTDEHTTMFRVAS